MDSTHNRLDKQSLLVKNQVKRAEPRAEKKYTAKMTVVLVSCDADVKKNIFGMKRPAVGVSLALLRVTQIYCEGDRRARKSRAKR